MLFFFFLNLFVFILLLVWRPSEALRWPILTVLFCCRTNKERICRHLMICGKFEKSQSIFYKPEMPPLLWDPVTSWTHKNSVGLCTVSEPKQGRNTLISLSHLSQKILHSFSVFNKQTTETSEQGCHPRFNMSACAQEDFFVYLFLFDGAFGQGSFPSGRLKSLVVAINPPKAWNKHRCLYSQALLLLFSFSKIIYDLTVLVPPTGIQQKKKVYSKRWRSRQ